MDDVQFLPNDKGVFFVEDKGTRIAEMIVGLSGNELSVYHTEVDEKLEGQGIGSRVIEKMVQHAEENKYIVIPYCPFVKAKFTKDPERFKNVWKEKDR